MTTIAWDGKWLAADRCRVNGRGTRQRARKLFDCGDYVYAGTGDLGDVHVVARWLRDGAAWDKRPEMDDPDGSSGIAVRKSDGATYVLNGKRATLCELPPGPAASGSGSPYALAAMACGKDARGAVKVAALFDDGTGFGVDAVRVRR